jgi:hypothetical protein
LGALIKVGNEGRAFAGGSAFEGSSSLLSSFFSLAASKYFFPVERSRASRRTGFSSRLAGCCPMTVGNSSTS